MIHDATTLTNLGKTLLRVLTALLVAIGTFFVSMACTPEKALAATTVNVVADDSFAPKGYEWFLDFTGIEIESGWQHIDDLSDGHIGSYFAPDVIQPGQDGFAAFIDESTPAGADFTLRMTGGSYDGTPIDALVSISDWDYWDGPADGSVGASKYFTSATWGLADRGAIYFNPNWTSDSSLIESGTWPSTLNNLNFFSSGMRSFTVSVMFVEAGTNSPIQVAGHMTCTDLDCMQSFSFGGAVEIVEIAQKSTATCAAIDAQSQIDGLTSWLNIVDRGSAVYGSSLSILADDSDRNYQRGLVGTYFDTGRNGVKPIELTFSTPYGVRLSPEARTLDPSMGVWSEADQCQYVLNPVGFFSMTPEYLANPPKHEGGGATIVKEVLTESPVDTGDTVSWRITATLPQEGIHVRTGYELESLVITDDLSEYLAYSLGSATVSMDGQPLPKSAYSFVSYQDPGSGQWTIECAFTRDYLESLRCQGQQIVIDFDTVALDYPSPKVWDETRLPIPNVARIFIIGESVESEPVYAEMFAPKKTINGDTELVRNVRLGDTVTYAIEQQVHNIDWDKLTKYRAFSVSDTLPEYVEYVEGSFEVRDPYGKLVDASAGTFAYDAASNTVSYAFTSEYLQNGMVYNGGSYAFSFRARAVDQPADDLETVKNHALVTANDVTEKTNVVEYLPETPELTVEKHADLEHELASVIADFEYLSGSQNPDDHSLVHLEGSFPNIADRTRAKNVTFTDRLPAGLELVPGSVKAAGAEGITIAEDTEHQTITITVEALEDWEEVTYEYECKTTDAGNGLEVVNTAQVWATNVHLGTTGAEDKPAADDGEIYINDPVIEVTKVVSESAVQNNDYQGSEGQQREEYRVGDEITYTVTLVNTAAGTFAHNLMLTDDGMPEGLELIGDVQVSGLSDKGKNKQVFYPLAGTSDAIHGEGETRTINWGISPVRNEAAGTWGWELNIDYLPANYPVTVIWTVKPTAEVNGWEIYNQARATADNQPNDVFVSETPCVWINTPEFDVEKFVSKTDQAYQVGDTATYQIILHDLLTPGTVARQTVLADAFATQGTSIIEGSFVITDKPEQALNIADSVELNRYVGDQSWRIDMTQVYGDETGYWVNDEPYFVWAGGALTRQSAQNPLGVTEHSYFKVLYEASLDDMALQNEIIVNEVTATSLEGYPASDTAEVTAIGAQLSVEKNSNDGGSFEVGDVAAYEVVVTNMATGTVAENVRIEDAFTTAKAGAAMVVEGSLKLRDASGTPIEGWEAEYTRNESGNIIGFSVETGYDLASSGEIILSYEVKYLSANGSDAIVNVARAQADNAPEASDEHETWPADADRSSLLIAKGSDAQTYAPGSFATYSLRVTNGSDEVSAENVRIHDELDAASSGIAGIVKGSVRVYDEAGNARAAQVVYGQNDAGRITSFDVEVPGSLTADEAIEIVYQVKIDEGVAQGTQVGNACWAAADNTGKANDEHDVRVDGSIPAKPPIEDEKPDAPDPNHDGRIDIDINNENVNENNNDNENNNVIDILIDLVSGNQDEPQDGLDSDPNEDGKPNGSDANTHNTLKGLDKTGDQLAAWLSSSWQWLLVALGSCTLACWFVPRLAGRNE